MTFTLKFSVMVVLLLLSHTTAVPGPLQAIVERGTLVLCANPDALPWASKTGAVRAFRSNWPKISPRGLASRSPVSG
jgi:hypothetical protein